MLVTAKMLAPGIMAMAARAHWETGSRTITIDEAWTIAKEVAGISDIGAQTEETKSCIVKLTGSTNAQAQAS